ncbi:MAG: ribosome maturation factor RimP [Campylobacterales bacterium]|nr:ribosome maturation factor RimP [Campylobacterales bacterium]
MKSEEAIAKIVASHGATLYDTEIASEFDETIFRVYITKEGGVSLDLCSAISHDLSLYFDVNSPLEVQYRLEVSSPGIERVLNKPKHFANSIGEMIKLRVVDEGNIIGVLKSFDDNTLVVDIEGKERSIDMGSIKKARTYFEW